MLPKVLLIFSFICSVGVAGKETSPVKQNLTYQINTTNRKCDRKPSNMQLVYFTSLIVFIPITVLGNALVCTTAMLSPALAKRPMYLFLTSLAIADLLCGAISMPIKAKMEWNGGCFHLPWFICWIFNIIEISISIISTIHLFAIAIDRYIALKYTYKYSDMMSRRTYRSVLVAIWSFASVWSIFGIFQWDRPQSISIKKLMSGCVIVNRVYFTVTYALLYIAPIFLMSFIYSFIYKTALHHINELSKTEVYDSNRRKEVNRRKKQFKSFRSIVIIFMAYTICWMPCVIIILIVYYKKSMASYFRAHWFIAVRFVFINFLPHLNSTLNPFIYVISNREFLSSLRKLIEKTTGRPLQKNKTLNKSKKTMATFARSPTKGMEMPPLRCTPLNVRTTLADNVMGSSMTTITTEGRDILSKEYPRPPNHDFSANDVVDKRSLGSYLSVQTEGTKYCVESAEVVAAEVHVKNENVTNGCALEH